MFNPIFVRTAPGSRPTPFIAFFRVFASVFLLVVVTATLVTFILPETFLSTARIRLQRAVTDSQPTGKQQQLPGDRDSHWLQTELEVIRSEAVLGKVVQDLNLNEEWSRQYGGGEKLATAETLALLKKRLDLRLVPGADIIEILAFSQRPSEAARIANAIAEAYTRHVRADSTQPGSISRVEIVDRAVPGFTPAKPNKFLNIALGVIVGALLGLAVGAAATKVRVLSPSPATPPPSR